MKKLLIAAALAFLGFSASAETITLTGSGCNGNRDCYPVANDLGIPITLHATLNAVYFYISVDGVMYHGQSSNGDLNQVATSDDGRTITVYVQFRHWTTRQQSGRGGGYYTQHWAIVGGQITR